jgi:hypothetical protein
MDTQEVADQLARELHRSVALTTTDRRILGVAYAAADQPDPLAPAATHVVEPLMLWIGSNADSTLICSGWVVIPLTVHGLRVGFALVSDNGCTLDSRERALLELAAIVVAASSASNGEDADIREIGLSRLLSYDAAERRAALHRARVRRWIPSTGTVTVHALLFDDHGTALSRHVTLLRVCRRLNTRVEMIRARGNVVFLLADDHADVDLGTVLCHALHEAGVSVIGAGSASVRIDDDDLSRAAHAAETAAEVTVAVPELAGQSRADSLGGWALLHAVSAQRELLSVASPAAVILCTAGDSHRETVETYLDAAGQVRETCERLHIHRTTLYYRLDNLPPVVKDALADGMQRSTLHLALKLDRLWTGSKQAVPQPHSRAPQVPTTASR